MYPVALGSQWWSSRGCESIARKWSRSERIEQGRRYSTAQGVVEEPHGGGALPPRERRQQGCEEWGGQVSAGPGARQGGARARCASVGDGGRRRGVGTGGRGFGLSNAVEGRSRVLRMFLLL